MGLNGLGGLFGTFVFVGDNPFACAPGSCCLVWLCAHWVFVEIVLGFNPALTLRALN